MQTLERSKLSVREATPKDTKGIIKLSQLVYGKKDAFSVEMIRSQLRRFPEGQFVAEYENEIVGHCATFCIKEKYALNAHTWDLITGAGFASRHNEDGDILYGMEVCVDEKHRGLRIGQRLYDARKRLCEELKLKGIVFGGRMPGLARRARKAKTPEDYLELVKEKKIRDAVLNFQIRNGFEPIGVLRDYLPEDKASLGHAVHMIWRNPLYQDDSKIENNKRRTMEKEVRVASVQFQARKVESFEQFAEQLEYFVDVAADYRADFVLFPEMLTIPLISKEKKKLSPQEAILKVTEYTDQFVEFMQNLALSYNINIIGGSHPTIREENEIENICYVFLRDGSVHTQAKLHPTPSEREWWNIKGGKHLSAIDTDCGPIGVLICYDSEFPEAARYLADQGAMILFVPFCTDEKQGYNRVRFCCQARAIENQMYVATAGIVGNLPDVENMDIHYAESCILTPCDFPFARDGVAATSAPNTEMIVFADLRLDNLISSRISGTVRNLNDRRFDMYKVQWFKSKMKQ